MRDAEAAAATVPGGQRSRPSGPNILSGRVAIRLSTTFPIGRREMESRSRHEVCCPSPEARRHRKSCAHADGCAAERRVAPTQMVARPRDEDPAGSEVLAPVERGASEVSTARSARPPAGKGCSSVREGGAGFSEAKLEEEIYVTGKKAHS